LHPLQRWRRQWRFGYEERSENLNRLSENYEVTYQNDIQHSYMVIRLQEPMQLLEYQIRMIQENPSPQLLSLHKKRMDKHEYLYYDITSKITLAQLLKRKKLNQQELLLLIRSLIKGLELSKLYLLQGGSFILSEDYIYVDPANLELSLAYLPISGEAHTLDSLKSLLLDMIVYKASFATAADGSGVYELLETIKREDFSLKGLVNAINKLESNGPLESPQGQPAQKKEPERKRGPRAPSASDSGKTNRTEKLEKDPGAFLLVQLFFAAGAVFLFRLLYYSTEGSALSEAIGAVLLLAACDYFVVSRLKLWDKKAPKQEEREKKKKMNKATPLPGRKQAAVETGAAASKAEPQGRALETQWIMEGPEESVFLEGCDEGKAQRIYIDRSSFVIGRLKSQVDYLSDNNAVGKLHAEIIKKGTEYFIRDLNSRNGTYVNGERISSNIEHPMKNDDQIGFADSQYRFVYKKGPREEPGRRDSP
jgi:hypothetical protein